MEVDLNKSDALLAIEYGPNSIQGIIGRGIAIVPSIAILRKIYAQIPDDHDVVVLGVKDFDAARGSIAIRKKVFLLDNGNQEWRIAAEKMIASVNGYINALPGSLIVTRGDDIIIKPVDWIWSEWLARAKLHILAGLAGTGKTTIALSLCATVTVGGKFPNGTIAETGNIVIWSGEDDPSDTLAPRLKAMGADMGKVHFISGVMEGQTKRPFDPATDIIALVEMVEKIRPALLIVDPIVSAVAGDSHNNADTRRCLQPLVDMALETGVAVLGISHFSKGSTGRNPTERVTGSLAFGALARVVMVAAKVEEEGGGRIFCRAKSNIGADDGGFRYDLEQIQIPDHPNIEASYVRWGEPVTGSARQLLATAEAGSKTSKLLIAEEFLNVELKDGAVLTNLIRDAADQAGHTWRTIERAKDNLGIISEKIKGGWQWRLPRKTAINEKDRQEEKVAVLDSLSGLPLHKTPDGIVEVVL